MVGTFLYCLYNSSDSKFQAHDGAQVLEWADCKRRKFCMFYTDVPHKVTTCTEGIRVILSFKIYKVDKPVSMLPRVDTIEDARRVEDESMMKFMSAVACHSDEEVPTVGFLFSHEYPLSKQSLDPSMFKGQDAILFRAITNPAVVKDWWVAMVKVETTMEQEYYDAPQETTSIVKLIDESKIMEKIGVGTTPATSASSLPDKLEDIPFFDFGSGYEWKNEEDSGAEHTGNESRAASADSLYIHLALIAQLDKEFTRVAVEQSEDKDADECGESEGDEDDEEET